jgi:predicted AAA+ superfamily ATPase
MNKSYLESIINSDINSCDGVVRNPIKIDLLIKSISRSICRLPNIESYINDIYNECNSVVSLNTVKNYIEALKNIFIIEEIPA